MNQKFAVTGKNTQEKNNDSSSSTTVSAVATTTKRKVTPFAIWVISIGLVFSGFDLLYGISGDLPKLSASSDPFLDLMVLFIIVCFAATAGTVLRKTWGYILGALASIGFIVAANAINAWIPTLSHPQDYNTFIVADSIVPVLVLVAVLTVLCVLNRKEGVDKKKYLLSPRSFTGVLTIVIVALVLVGALVGVSISSSAKTASGAPTIVSISIVNGAFNPSSSTHFVPATVTLVIGVNNTVTWTNNDYTIHTVTSNSNLFNSGLLNHGNTWTYTFTSPGTYPYHCSVHPFMTGTIVVVQ